MNNPIIYQAVGGLLVVFFLVSIYFFTKTWRWHQILALFSVFVSSIFLLYYAALVYRTHNAWRTLESKTTAQAKKLADELELLRHGDLFGGEQKDLPLMAINGKVGRSIIDLGRVWRHCTPQGAQPDGTVIVSTVPAGMEIAPAAPEMAPVAPTVAPAPVPGAAPGAAAPGAPAAPPAPAGPPPNRIDEKTVLYVFIEALAPPEAGLKPGAKIPRYYLGEFIATAVTDTTVTLGPVFPLSPMDVTLMRQEATWSLYETLPVDGHELFAVNPDEGGKLNESAQEFSVFGTMDPKLLEVLFPPPQRTYFEQGPAGDQAFQIAAQRHAVMMKNYARDGLRASNDDPLLNVWLKVRFQEKYSEVVDSRAKVSPLQLGATDDFFDRGLAEVAMLQRGANADFKPGDVAVFPQEDGNRLLQEKTADGKPICELIEPVYVRTLNNYAFLYRDLFFRTNRVNSDIARINRDIAEIKRTQQHTSEQLVVANSEQTKLNADIGKTDYEESAIIVYLAALQKSADELKAQLSLLYRSNLQLEAELERANEKLTEDINRRTRSVAGAP